MKAVSLLQILIPIDDTILKVKNANDLQAVVIKIKENSEQMRLKLNTKTNGNRLNNQP